MDNVEHIILDLETLGNTPGCGIIAIGAVSLDLHHRFYEKISPASNRSYRLHTDKSTLAWWDRQSEEARNESFSGTKNLDVVLKEFSDWFVKLSPVYGDIEVWGNGADFDLPILHVAYKEAALHCPIGVLSGRCYRTLKKLFPHIKKGKFIGEKHTAIADARSQAEHLNELLEFVKAVGK